MNPHDLIEAAGGSPIVVWLVVIIGLALMISTAAPKVLGPISQAIFDTAEKFRVNAARRDDADLADLNRQVRYLRGRVHSLEEALDRLRAEWSARYRRWSAEKRAHDRWDYEASRALLSHEPPFDPPPEYLTPDTLTDPTPVVREDDPTQED